jgi:hypothetical protein
VNPILLISAGFLAYLWYTSKNATSASCTPTGSTAPLTVASVTAAAQSAGLTVGQLMTLAANSGDGTLQCLQSLFPTTTPAALPASMTADAPTGGSITVNPPLPTGDVPASGGMSLAALYTAMVNAASTDQQFTNHDGDWWGTPYHWNFYVSYVDPGSPVNGMTWPPNPSDVFPGVDLNQPMASKTYWAAMSPWLQSKYGMSGLRGLGAVQFAFAHRGGWAA